MNTSKIKATLSEIWSVKYLPTKLEDLAATDDVYEVVKDCLDTGSLPNHLCFCGPPGTGKNSIVNILRTNLQLNTLVINASEERGIDTIREKVLGFANSGALFNHPKLIIMNEADGLGQLAQDSMKELMETSSNNCRFLFTCNHINKIDSALISRFSVYKIDPPISAVVKRLAAVLKKENIKFTKEFLISFVKIKGRDLRKLLNDAQSLSRSYDVLTESIFSSNTKDYVDFFDKIFEMKDAKAIGDKIKNQLFDEDIYKVLQLYCLERDISSDSISLIARYSDMSTRIYDKDIPLMGCIFELRDLINKK